MIFTACGLKVVIVAKFCGGLNLSETAGVSGLEVLLGLYLTHGQLRRLVSQQQLLR